MAIAITIVSSIISGFLATIITLFVNHRAEVKRIKRELVDDIFGYRYLLSDKMQGHGCDKSPLNRAFNRVPIIFNKNPKILEAYYKFFDTTDAQIKNDALITLYKEMCNDIGIDVENWNDSRINRIVIIE